MAKIKKKKTGPTRAAACVECDGGRKMPVQFMFATSGVTSFQEIVLHCATCQAALSVTVIEKLDGFRLSAPVLAERVNAKS